ncbi:hypothetical protein NKR23_g8229 [Pleurostoma richardsiae]|uniref:Uncharacterized protein n=1 Tax=Pleurostoma richardsiae TaxID=41990 RepID=A0AA38RRE9_9PEZI|nr:hypothetical protein NKR23_g8229 [Pleurostoma richardsiae]
MERLGAQAVVEFVTQGPVLAERASGVDWKCGQQGMRLMDTAIIEANPANAGYSPAFERKAYIDGVSFLLKGLPRDLDESEMIALGSSLPTTFGSMSATGGLPNSASSQAYGERNVLHRSIQTVVVKLFVLLHLIMPYVIFLLRQLAQLERKYKVSENVVGQTIELANAFGRCSVSLSGTIYNMSDGKVGQALANVFAWAIEGVAGGISDGVGEGLARVGARPE